MNRIHIITLNTLNASEQVPEYKWDRSRPDVPRLVRPMRILGKDGATFNCSKEYCANSSHWHVMTITLVIWITSNCDTTEGRPIRLRVPFAQPDRNAVSATASFTAAERADSEPQRSRVIRSAEPARDDRADSESGRGPSFIEIDWFGRDR